MKIKTVVHIVNTSYGALVLPAMLGIVYCLMVWEPVTMLVGLICVLALFASAYFLKTKLINYFLERCNYPREFLSVLDKKGLMGNLEIHWSEAPANLDAATQTGTEQFLIDNQLPKTFGNPNNKWMTFISFENDGLQVNQQKYNWTQVQDWELSNQDASIELILTYNKDGEHQTISINLRDLNLSEIDLLLLLSHFKITYG